MAMNIIYKVQYKVPENLYCHTMVASAPSFSENPDCQSNVKPPLRPKCETANVFRFMAMKNLAQSEKNNSYNINISYILL